MQPILYTGRHATALVARYDSMFPQPVPMDVAALAMRAGTLQDMMQAIDEAVRYTKQPVTDWQPFLVTAPWLVEARAGKPT